MSDSPMTEVREERHTEWIEADPYVVGVKVVATYFPSRPHEPCLASDQMKLVEEARRRAEVGDLAWLIEHTDLCVRVPKPTKSTPDGS